MLNTATTTGRSFSALRAREFARLDREGVAYLDYTGAALYAESLLRSHHELLAKSVFGNPHSENEPSRTSSQVIEQAREMVLQFFDADPDMYVVCFTANCSAAIKLVAESYPFQSNGVLALSMDNHNSVNGIREYARRGGASIQYLPLDDELRLDVPQSRLRAIAELARGPKLFAFPAQSNFSGVQHPLGLVQDAERLGFDVLVDAAAFVPGNRLSLRVHSPAFVAFSFYKMFGYPTGVGALIVRRDVMHKLSRPWFAGGTVEFASVQNDLHVLRSHGEGFEDGTPDFLNIAALAAGFTLMSGVGVDRLHGHVMRLTGLLLDGLRELTHPDGSPLVRLYGPPGIEARGGTVAFNVLMPDGTPVPYAAVECRARGVGVAVRGGCFCNPGAAEQAFGFEARRTRQCLEELREGFTTERLASCLGERSAVGAVRVSVGMANNEEDVRRGIGVVRGFAG